MLTIIGPSGSPRAQKFDPIRIFPDGSGLAEAIAPNNLDILIPRIGQLWTRIEMAQAECKARDRRGLHVGRALFFEGGTPLLLVISPTGKRSVFVASKADSIAHLALIAFAGEGVADRAGVESALRRAEEARSRLRSQGLCEEDSPDEPRASRITGGAQ